jgi:hypothetical protein
MINKIFFYVMHYFSMVISIVLIRQLRVLCLNAAFEEIVLFKYLFLGKKKNLRNTSLILRPNCFCSNHNSKVYIPSIKKKLIIKRLWKFLAKLQKKIPLLTEKNPFLTKKNSYSRKKKFIIVSYVISVNYCTIHLAIGLDLLFLII